MDKLPKGHAETTGSLANVEYQNVTVKKKKPQEEDLLASPSKNLPTDEDLQKGVNFNQTEELPSVGTELVKKNSVKVFDDVKIKNKLDKIDKVKVGRIDKKRNSDHLDQVINVVKLEESQEEDEYPTKPVTRQQGSNSQSDFDDLEFADASSDDEKNKS